jgi:hypothetical protein
LEQLRVVKVLEGSKGENQVDLLQSVPVVINFDETKTDPVEETTIVEGPNSKTNNSQEIKSIPRLSTENSEDDEINNLDTENAIPTSETQGTIYKTEMIIKNVHATISPEKSSTTTDVVESHDTVN